jgi:hypothetical protein
MPIDASIPLQVQSIDTANPLLNFMKMKAAKTEGDANQLKLEDLKQNQELKSLAIGAHQVLPFLEQGDTQGALAMLKRRQQGLLDTGRDDSHTREAIATLESGDPKQITEMTQLAKQDVDLAAKLNLFEGKDTPSAIREYQYYNTLPDSQKKEYLNVKRNTLGLGMGFDAGGNVIPLPGAAGAKSTLSNADESGKQRAQSDYQPPREKEIAQNKADVEVMTKKTESLPKAKSSLDSYVANNKNVISNIDDAISKVSNLSAGYGEMFSGLPNTDANALKNQLDTIKANIGFDRLQEMRTNSPTGGALGNVSDFENRNLQAVLGSLDQKQGAKQLVATLQKVKSQLEDSGNRLQSAFDQDFKDVLDKQNSGGLNSPQGGEVPLARGGKVIKWDELP